MTTSHHPFLIIISSPSGAGKSTLCSLIIKNDPNIKLSISTTTRAKRSSETNGKDYLFISKDKFHQMIDQNQFLEHAQVFDNLYGSPKQTTIENCQNNIDTLFDVDWQGAKQIRQNYDVSSIISIFILPPSIQELQRRLEKRAQDSSDIVAKRMRQAKDEISHFHEYDYVIVNDDIDDTYQKIKQIINCMRIKRDKEIKQLAQNLIN